MFQVELKGVLAVVAIAMCWALALLLFRTGTSGSMARRLSLLLMFEGFTLGTSDSMAYFLTSPAAIFAKFSWLEPAQRLLHTIGDCGMLVLYPPFLAAALNTPLTRPFGNKRVQRAILVLGVGLYLIVNLTPDFIGLTAMFVSLVLMFGYAMVAAIHSWQVAPSRIARSRAMIFVLAFGFRDLCWGFVYAIAVLAIWRGHWDIGDTQESILYFAYVLGTLVAVPMIAYGILRTQLFDIDLKIRWTIKQSTLAGAIIAIVFVISEGASQILSAELGNIAGLLAAAVVVFFLVPLQRFAENVASAAMPNTKDTPEYIAFRKLQVYESAVAEAMQEGGVSQKERALLNRLRDSLGVSVEDADSIERDLQAGEPGMQASPASP